MEAKVWKRIACGAVAVTLAAMLLLGSIVFLSGRAEPSASVAQSFPTSGKRHVFHSSAVTNANGAAMDVVYYPAVGIQVQGITTATVEFECTVDRSNWNDVQMVNVETGAVVTSTTSDGVFAAVVGGLEQVRCPITGYAGGTITVSGSASTGGGRELSDMSGLVDIDDISQGTQTNDVKVTLDGEIASVASASDLTVTLDSEVVSVDATGQGDIPITLDGESLPAGTNALGTITVTSVTTGEIDVGAVSGIVSVDATGQGDVPISTSRDLTVTLDSEIVTVDSELPAAGALGDGATNPTVPKVGAGELLFNNTTWDRERNNFSVWPFPNACYTYIAPVVGEEVTLTNYNARGAYIVVSITGIGLNQTLTVKGYVYDYDAGGVEASDQEELIWASAALTPTGRHTYLIYPGAGAAANDVVETVSYPLPRIWNLGVTVNNSEPITFSIGVHYIN